MSSREVWAIRVLNGNQAGQIYPLNSGYNLIGRGPTCNVKFASNSVSKEHASVLITDDGKVILSDMNSRNGTFVNGLRVQNQKLGAGDKITFHDLMVDLLRFPPGTDLRFLQNALRGGSAAHLPAWAGNAAQQLQPQPQTMMQPGPSAPYSPQPQMSAVQDSQSENDEIPALETTGNPFLDFSAKIQHYIDQVAMPGVYALVQSMNFKQGLLLLIGAYAAVVTFVTTIPVISATRNSLQHESLRRAKTIARNLAALNRQAVLDRNEVGASTQTAELEEGVASAVVINREGTILAPANKRGEFAKLPFVSQARREERETEAIIDNSTLGVAVPINRYNPETGTREAAAYAVIIYDMGSMVLNASETLGLFLQIALLAAGFGILLYFFLNRVVEHPVRILGSQLDDALREGRDDLSTPYHWPLFENLVSNVNSALTRAANAGVSLNSASAGIANRDLEAANIIRMLSAPALAINAIDDRVIASNSSFDRLLGANSGLNSKPLSEIPDPALQANLIDLIPKMRQQLASIALSEIPFSGSRYEVNGQAILGANGEAAWYLVVLNSMDP